MLDSVKKNFMKIITAVILISVLARVAFVFITPIDSWGTDSSNHARYGKDIATFNELPGYDIYAIQFLNWAPPFYHLIEAVSYKLIPSLDIFKVISLVFGVLTIPLCYLTFKKLSGKEIALLSTFFLSIYPVFMRLSTSIIVDAATLFFSFLVIYSLVLSKQTKKRRYYVLLMSAIALMMLTKHTGLIMGGIVFLWELLNRGEIKKYFIITLFAFLIGSTWYVRNYTLTGNPFSWQLADSSTTEIGTGTIWSQISSNLNQYYTRFWDGVETSDFANRGIISPISFIGIILTLYMIMGMPYFAFFFLGLGFKGDANRFMMLLLFAYIGFSLYYLTSGWGLNFIPRVGIFAFPAFCYFFAKGLVKVKDRIPLITILFLVFTGIVYISFEGMKLYVKNNDEYLYYPGYTWIKENISKDSLILSHQWAQISLFTERKSAQTIPNDTSAFGSMYIYDRERTSVTLGCPTANCTLLYNDTYVNIFKIK